MNQISRRTFCRRSLQAAAGMALAQPLLGTDAPTMRPVLPRRCPPNRWRKRGVVLEATEPWECGEIQNFTSPVEPIGRDRWRLWYSAIGDSKRFSIAYAEGVPGGSWKKYPLNYTSREAGDGPFTLGHLPDGWRPTQVIHIRLNDGRHRIYFWAHGKRILRYLAADSNDGRRYRVADPHRPVLYHPHDRAAWGVTTSDGMLLHGKPSKDRPADEPPATSMLITNDATTIYQLADGSFELYSAALVPVPEDDPAYIAHDNAAGLVRVIDRFVSEDGLRFEGRQRVIQREPDDPVDQQFYYLSVTHTPQGRVGMLGHYRVQAQTMDLEWCFSTNGLKWERPERTPWIARADKTRPDSYGIYAPHALVQHDGRYHLFYTAVNSAHNGKHSHGPPRTVVMHATTDSIWA